MNDVIESAQETQGEGIPESSETQKVVWSIPIRKVFSTTVGTTIWTIPVKTLEFLTSRIPERLVRHGFLDPTLTASYLIDLQSDPDTAVAKVFFLLFLLSSPPSATYTS